MSGRERLLEHLPAQQQPHQNSHSSRTRLGLGAAWPDEALQLHCCVQPAKAAANDAHTWPSALASACCAKARPCRGAGGRQGTAVARGTACSPTTAAAADAAARSDMAACSELQKASIEGALVAAGSGSWRRPTAPAALAPSSPTAHLPPCSRERADRCPVGWRCGCPPAALHWPWRQSGRQWQPRRPPTASCLDGASIAEEIRPQGCCNEHGEGRSRRQQGLAPSPADRPRVFNCRGHTAATSNSLHQQPTSLNSQNPARTYRPVAPAAEGFERCIPAGAATI